MEYPVVSVLEDLSLVLCDVNDGTFQKENLKKIATFVERTSSIFTQLEKLDGKELTPGMHTAMQGLLKDLRQLKDVLLLYKSKGRLYVLVKCESLNNRLKSLVSSMGRWLVLFSVGLQHYSDLCKEIMDLSYNMEQSQLKISKMEQHILTAIDKRIADGVIDDITTSNALLLNIARTIGIDESQFPLQIERFKIDLEDLESTHNDTQIAEMLEKLANHCQGGPDRNAIPVDDGHENEGSILPFRTFICPLSKDVMKDPVVLETDQTYDKSEIETWFNCCLKQGKLPTCPVTGQVLKSLEWRKNIDLKNTIEEWKERNYRSRIVKLKQKLESNALVEEDLKQALEEVHKVSEEGPKNRYILRCEGLIPLVLRPWHEPLDGGHEIRNMALIALHSMVSDNEENKLEAAKVNALRYAVKSLTSSHEEEKESAARLLLELSSQSELQAKIGCQKGAILLLSEMATNMGNASLSSLASQTLRKLEEEYLNIIPMAEAGRLKPLLDCLSKGPVDARLKMVKLLAQMDLTNDDKESVVKQAGSALIEMLYQDIFEKEAALKTLLMLSILDGNAVRLVNDGILPPLLAIINSSGKSVTHHSSLVEMKEMAVEILANLVSKPGHWELSPADSDGNTLNSEPVIQCFLQLMTRVGYRWKPKLLRVLNYIASSPQATEAAVSHIEAWNGIALLIVYIREPEIAAHLDALKLLGIISKAAGAKVAEELRRAGQFDYLMELLKGSNLEERDAVAFILGNITLSETEVLEVLGLDLLPWIVDSLRESTLLNRHRHANSQFTEGLLGLLLHFSRSSNARILLSIREFNLIKVFREHLCFHGDPSHKTLAAQGLCNLSQKAVLNMANPKPSSSCSCFGLLLCGKHTQDLCLVHGAPCHSNAGFCLVEADAVKPLVELLGDENVGVQLAATEALSTLLENPTNLASCVGPLLEAEGVRRIVKLFCATRPGELRDKLLWIIERILRIEEFSKKCSADQVLIKTLIQAFRSPNPTTKRLAQIALGRMNQLSAMESRTGT